MSIQDKIKVDTYYTRSIYLERDADSLDAIKAYIPTSRALRTFSRVAETFNQGQVPRSWSLVGPYGSGKSSFSMFLSQLLSKPDAPSTKVARKILRKADKKLARTFVDAVDNTEGYLKILITGTPESMGKRILKGMYVAASAYWGQRSGKNPAIVAQLERATKTADCAISDTLNLMRALQTALAKTNCGGVLLIIDELGKFLEYEGRHYGANDIYLLQLLAEHACEDNPVNLLLFVLLHQSFDQYAKGLGEHLKNEWAKVQGRFEEVPFLESAEQVLKIVSAAFTYKITPTEQQIITNNINDVVTVLIDNEVLSKVMTHKQALDLLSTCYPLHPVSAILLPVLCQKLAQNERTLFSYLGSHEDFGLQDLLAKFNTVEELIYPHHIYDYFIANQPTVMSDYSTNRRWAEVITAIERLGDANKDEVNLLKTIGILNIIGSKGGFKASKAILEKCTVNKTKYAKAIKALLAKSIVNFRRFNNEYRVWQGSDFDLEAALQEEKNNLGDFSVATILNDAKNMFPIVARRYTIESGTLRYFVPVFVDAKTYLQVEPKCSNPRIIFYLALAQDDEQVFRQKVPVHFSKLDIVALCLNAFQLREAIAETVSLKRVRINNQALNMDNIAVRELQDRLAAAEFTEQGMLADLLDSPVESHWFNNDQNLNIQSKRILQEQLSSVLQRVYHATPIINNELINRDHLSAQGNGARSKLLLAMLRHEDKADLAIEKFPAEKAIYRALLLETGLHRQDEQSDSWKFTAPALDKRTDQYNMHPVWKRINKFLDGTEKKPKAMIELNEELMAPPYGVKAGVLPVLYIAAYLCYQHEIAIYDNRQYKPYFTEEMLVRFIKRPNEFTFQQFRIKGLRKSIFKQYSEVINSNSVPKTVLELAKPLAQFMGQLPEYTQKTRRLKDSTIKVRAAFNLAKSPHSLLFNELPEALGFKDLVVEEDVNEKNFEGFTQALTESLTELRNVYAKLLEKQQQLLANAFNVRVDKDADLKALRGALMHHCFGLENYTIDTQGLRAFIMRVNKSTGSDADWLENILLFLGHKPSKKWLDSDQDIAEYRLATFSRNVTDLRKLEMHEVDRATKIDDDFDVYLLSSLKKGRGILNEIVSVDKKSRAGITTIKTEINEQLAKLSDRQLVWAALAEVVDEHLIDDANTKESNMNATDDLQTLGNKG